MDLAHRFFFLCILLTETAAASAGHILSIRQQSNITLPGCALTCIVELLPASSCDVADITCLCSDQLFQNGLYTCIANECSVIDSLEAQKTQATAICPQPIRNKSGLIDRVAWSGYGIAVFSVAARLLSRFRLLGGSGYGWDDGMICLGLALLTPFAIIASTMAHDGIGQDMWMLAPKQITDMLHLLWIEEYIYTFLLNVTKISVLLLYLRMFPDSGSLAFRHGCLALIGILCVHAVAMNLVLTVGCLPISYSWTFWDGLHQGECINREAQIYITAGLNITFDLLVYLLPLPKLLKLSFASAAKKSAVCLTFLVGLSVTICSAIRLQYLTAYGTSSNLSWTYGPIVIWSIVECNLSVICACVPSLAGAVQRTWAYATGAPTNNSYARGSSAISPLPWLRDRQHVRMQSSSLSMRALAVKTPDQMGGCEYIENQALESPVDFAYGRQWSPQVVSAFEH